MSLWAAVLPLDVAKTRIQVASPGSELFNTASLRRFCVSSATSEAASELQAIVRPRQCNGVSGLTRGVAPASFRSGGRRCCCAAQEGVQNIWTEGPLRWIPANDGAHSPAAAPRRAERAACAPPDSAKW